MRVWRFEGEAATEEALRSHLESRGYDVTRWVYPPGTRFPPHAHGVDKLDAVVRGSFRMEIAGERMVLGPGEAVEVPAGVVHSADVVGDEPVVSLDAVRRA